MFMLFSRWIVPPKLRRLPRPVKAVLIILFLSVLLSLCFCNQPNLRPEQYNSPIDDKDEWATWLYLASAPALSAIVGLLVGALLVAPTIQKRTWNDLVLTRLRPFDVVNARLLVRIVQGVVVTLPFTVQVCVLIPFRVVKLFNLHIDIAKAIWQGNRQMILLLLYPSFELLMHFIVFLLMGTVVSVLCRRTSTALIIASCLIVGYGVVYFTAQGRNYSCFHLYDDHLYAHVFYWPVYSSLADNAGTMLRTEPYVSDNAVALHQIAVGIWCLVVPMICYGWIRWKINRLQM